MLLAAECYRGCNTSHQFCNDNNELRHMWYSARREMLGELIYIYIYTFGTTRAWRPSNHVRSRDVTGKYAELTEFDRTVTT